ncbi:MAG: nuclear transport factor 2 family protein [Devosia sp.]|nr:MAG: nuclear transport factor 2 family protein [Devosia sp.]
MDAYAEGINAHDFDLLEDLIDADAVFWFSSGSYRGLPAIRAAFEATWTRLQNETYWLEELAWIASDDGAAACTYSFRWRAEVDGSRIEGGGRGTSVLRRRAEGWLIVHEHLSAEPT